MDLLIAADGETRMIYQEDIDLSTLGAACIQRASHVEPDEQGRWWADLTPVDGMQLGPFAKRKDALDSELIWIQRNVLK